MSTHPDIAQDLWLQNLYLSEIEALCNDAEISVKYINDWLANGQQDTAVLFYHLRMLINLAAIVSQFLWPISEGNRAAQLRGKVLRDLLRIHENNPLKSRKFRHHLAHFDERLDEWATKSPHRNIVRRSVMPRRAISGESLTPGDFLEHFVPVENIVIFRGDEFPVQQTADALMEIRATAAAAQQRLREAQINSRRSA
jgi:hypothetical protein